MHIRSARGFTLIELLIVVGIIGVIAAIAIPGLLRARMSGNEASAIGSLRALVSAQLAYASVCGRNHYAPTFAQLAVPAPGSSHTFMPSDLAAAIPEKSGYRLTLSPGAGAAPGPADCNGNATTTAYYATAVPTNFLSSGSRSFAVNTAGTIWQAPAAAAPIEPFSAPSTPIQ